MRIVTYNVHSCRGVDGRLSPERIAAVIAATDADVACLQELDVGRARTSCAHQAGLIAEQLAMQFHFFPAIRLAGEEYGDAILSRDPLRLVRSGMLPATFGALEPRGALWVEIESGGVGWQVFNTHLGLARGERRVQARALAEWIAEALPGPPVIVCGDLNSRRGSHVHRLLGSGLQEVQAAIPGAPRPTFSTRFPWVCLDYIYVSADVQVLSAEVVTNPMARLASDHFPLVAEVTYPAA